MSQQRSASVVNLPLNASDDFNISDAMNRRFSDSRNLFILDNVEDSQVVELLVSNSSTTVVVTDDADILAALGVDEETTVRVEPIDIQASIGILQSVIGVQKAEAEAQALRELAEDFCGLPASLQAVGLIVASDRLSTTPVAMCLNSLRTAGLTQKSASVSEAVRRVALLWERYFERLPPSSKVSLARLSVLPSGGFGTLAAKAALGVESGELNELLNALTRYTLLLPGATARHWRLTKDALRYANQSGELEKERAMATERVDVFFRAQLVNANQNRHEIDPMLLDDAETICQVALRSPEELAKQKSMLLGLDAVARRTGSWNKVLIAAMKLGWEAEPPQNYEGAVQLLSMGIYYSRASQYSKANDCLSRAIELLRPTSYRYRLAHALVVLARNLGKEYKNQEALSILEEARSIETNINPHGLGMAIVLHSLGRVKAALKDPTAEQDYKESIRIGEFLSDSQHLTQVLVSLGLYFLKCKRPDEAMESLIQSEEHAKWDRNPRQLALVKMYQGDVLAFSKQLEAAKHSYETSLNQARTLSDAILQFSIELKLANVLDRLGDTTKSSELITHILSDTSNKSLRANAGFRILNSLKRNPDPDSIIRLFEDLYEIGDQLKSSQGAVLYNMIGKLLSSQFFFSEALKSHRRAQQVCQSIGDMQGYFVSTTHVAMALAESGDNAEAIQLLEETLANEVIDNLSKANLLSALGSQLKNIGQLARAEEVLRETIDLERANDGIGTRVAYPLHDLGDVLIKRHRPQEALVPLEEALQIERQFGRIKSEMHILHTQARAFYWAGEYAQAELSCRESLQLEATQPDAQHRAQVLRTLGLTVCRLNSSTNSYKEALGILNESLLVAQKSNNTFHQSLVRRDIGRIHESTNNPENALAEYETALELLDKSKFLDLKASLTVLAARLSADTGQPLKARGYYEHTLKLIESTPKRMNLSSNELIEFARAYVFHLQDFDETQQAIDVLNRMESAARSVGNHELLMQLTWLHSRILFEQKQNLQADLLCTQTVEFLVAQEDFVTAQRIIVDWSISLENAGFLTKALSILAQYASSFEQAGAFDFVLFSLRYRLSALLLRARKFDAASMEAELALQHAMSTSGSHLIGKARLLMAEILLKVNNSDAAITVLLEEYDRLADGAWEEADQSYEVARLLKTIDSTRAEHAFRASWEVNIQLCRSRQASVTARELALVLRRKGQLQEAELVLDRTEKLIREKGTADDRAVIWHELGEVYRTDRRQNKRAIEAFRKCIDFRREAGIAPRLIWSLRVLSTFYRRDLNQPLEALPLAEEALELQRAQKGPRALRGSAPILIEYGLVLMRLDRIQEAIFCFDEAIAHAQEANSALYLGNARSELADAYRKVGRFSDCRCLLQQARDDLQNETDKNVYSIILQRLGRSLHTARRGVEAVQIWQEKLDLDSRNQANKELQIQTQSQLANSLRIAMLFAESHELCKRCIDDLNQLLAQTPPHRTADKERLTKSLLAALNALANTLFDMNRPNESFRTFREIEKLESNSAPPTYFTLLGLGKTTAAMSQAKKSQLYFAQALEAVRKEPLSLALLCQNRATAWMRNGQFAEAYEDLREALDFAGKIEDQKSSILNKAFVFARMATTSLALNEVGRAITEANLSLDLANQTESSEARIKVAISASQVFLSQNEPTRALEIVRRSLLIWNERHGIPVSTVTLLCLEAKALLALGQTEEAQRRTDDAISKQRTLENLGVRFKSENWIGDLFGWAETTLEEPSTDDSSVQESIHQPDNATFLPEKTPSWNASISSAALGESALALLEQLRKNQTVVIGKVLRVLGEEVAIQLNESAVGYCPRSDFYFNKHDPILPGLEVAVVVSELLDGKIVVSRRQAILNRLAEHRNRTFFAKVASVKPKFLFLRLGPDLSGFLHVTKFAKHFVEDLTAQVATGDILPVRILEFNANDPTLQIKVSHRDADSQELFDLELDQTV